ncbi:urease accessory protein UreF [Granulosicoccaceae sp. 1_MG-2023]|nr:urease accessory protein UreF [Granulosicoccaceae sp. 1_MG-2023]
MAIATEPGGSDTRLAQLRLMQLISPSLPVGSFTYSQGLEWAVEAGWVKDADDLQAWLGHLLREALAATDLALLVRLYDAALAGDDKALNDWAQLTLACRESAELRLEEANRGRALVGVLEKLDLPVSAGLRPVLAACQCAGFAYACAHWEISKPAMLTGYAWSWLENTCLAGVKIIPLGQSDGQRILAALAAEVDEAINTALSLPDDDIGAGSTALAIASSRHHYQYTRLFRS